MQELAKAVAASAPGGHKVWDSMVRHAEDRRLHHEQERRAGRPDETVMCIAADGGACRVVVEMKTEAPAGEAQLSKYVDAERSHTESVAGLLLRIPGKDRVEIQAACRDHRRAILCVHPGCHKVV